MKVWKSSATSPFLAVGSTLGGAERKSKESRSREENGKIAQTLVFINERWKKMRENNLLIHERPPVVAISSVHHEADEFFICNGAKLAGDREMRCIVQGIRGTYNR
jgi:hypothetical protein